MGYKFTLKTSLLVLAGSFSLAGYAQTAPSIKKFGKQLPVATCGTVEYESMLLKNNPKRADKQQFENWLAPQIASKKAKRLSAFSTQDQVVTIPVVVHVIHNGVPVGTNENINEDQILSQITVLNQDFRRAEGTNGFNNNEVGADIEVEFCLAQRDPDGLASNGIDRIEIPNYSPFGWSLEAVEAIKAQTQWDPEKYLNIWTFNMVTIQAAYEIYGYSQFPTDSTLDGLVDPSMSTSADTDGIIIKAGCFGSEAIYADGYYDTNGRNLGRTVSHEVGHFLGLRHIWGDVNNCTGDDYCADTPIALTQHQGVCPGDTEDSCPSSLGLDMWQNYMDYTNDSCLNIFTLDQKDRIRTVLENSPRRVSLITANSCTPGAVFGNDGSLNTTINTCSATITPKVNLTNSGTEALTAATITYHLDDAEPATVNWTGNLAQGEEALIEIPAIATTAGEHTFSNAIVTVNGVADEAPANDTKTKAFTITTFTTTQIIVNVRTDNNANQTLWVLLDSSQNEVYSYDGETYENNTLYSTTIDIDATDCYTFLILDTGGNGITGDGYYELTTTNGTVIKQGGEFIIIEETAFGIDAVLGIENPEAALSNISIYPNPANSIFTIAVPQNAATPDGYTIYNSLGQVVGTGKFASNQQPVDVSTYANGVYFVKINGEGSAKTLQFIKN